MDDPLSMPVPNGVYAACLTPFTDDLSVDVPRLFDHATWLLNHGCDGILLFGTTGEGLSLTAGERLETLRRLIDRGLPAERLLVGTGAAALPDLVTLTSTVTETGVGGVLVLPPFHFKECSDAGVHRTYDTLIQRVGDDDLRLYFYHFPQLSGVPIAFSVIERLRSAYPSQIAGIKDSSGEWDHTQALCRSFPDLQVFAGTERLLLPVLRSGGAGCISASANVTAPLAQRVYAAWTDTATGADPEALQKNLSELRTALASFPMIAALKALLADRNDHPSWRITRPPLTNLSPAEVDRLSDVHALLQKRM